MDDLTPMEPEEILELYEPATPPPEQQGYYGTAPYPKKHRHWGLVIALIFLVLLLTLAAVLMNFYEIRVERTDGGYSVSVLRRGAENAVADPSVGETIGLSSHPLEETVPEPSAAQPEDGLSLQEIYQRVLPSVVSVTGGASQNIGTGVILNTDGYIVTSYHVVEGSVSVQVLLYDDSTYTGTLVASDEITDLAVIKINAANLVPAEFGDSDALRVGDRVVAIGNPLGIALRGTMTDGIISAINRNLDLNGTQMTLIQTNAALNSGNSGGPLINAAGQVIGINTAKISTYYSSASVEGIGFAIPSATVEHIVGELLTSGYVTGRAAMHITVADINEVQRVYLQLPKGVYITDVDQDSNAYAAGIRYGDILVSINGTQIASTSEYTSKMASLSVGDTASVVIYRGGMLWTVDVVLEEQTQ